MGGVRLLAPGTRLGPYRVEAFLARGSTGEVYRATDERLGRSAALKVLPAWLEEDERARDRFLAEARAAASLDHPNVLPVYDAGEQEGTLWIAMRLAEGRDLRELLRREGPLAPERSIAILAGVAAALDAAHRRGILHRDVKPGNIVFGAEDAGGHSYLADFGLATAAHGRGLTRTGEVLGTIDYVSPEQARGEALDARSDAWSLAAVLFECLTGRPPFRRETEVAALTARLEGPAPAPSSLRADLPEALDAVFARGLARDPAERYASAGALIHAARAAVDGARLRGLLFADLRGYTAFAEREGDARAAALLDRYRRLVRATVARSGGAEIRTEGDSFYIVFPSATAAIRAGLAITAAAAEATAADPLLAVTPGVGVHAGEPLEAPEGPVGAAVNVAARLCSLALPGEVLVSTTARELARGSRDLAFTSRGLLAAKGLVDPLEAWSASRAAGAVTAAPAPGPVPGPATAAVSAGRTAFPARGRLLAGAGAVAVTLVAVIALGALAGSPAPGDEPASAASPGGSAGASAPAADPSPVVADATPASATQPAGTTPVPGPFPTEAEATLISLLPVGLSGACSRRATAQDAVLAGFEGAITGRDAFGSWRYPVTPWLRAGVLCRPTEGADRLYVIEPKRVQSSGDAPGDTYIGYLQGRWRIPEGSCAADDRAFERWRERQGTGLLACMNPYDGRPWIYFSFAKGRYLGFATRDDADYEALYSWWDQLKTFLP